MPGTPGGQLQRRVTQAALRGRSASSQQRRHHLFVAPPHSAVQQMLVWGLGQRSTRLWRLKQHTQHLGMATTGGKV
jgi:hypothetical protein